MIKLKDINFKYSNNEEYILKDINIEIKSGENILICGKSGCGKSTLIRIINGLIPHYYEGELSGQVFIEDEEISQVPLYRIAEKVGSVFQNPRTQFYNVETTSEIVFGCENMNIPKKEMLTRLNKVNKQFKLENLLNRSLFSLSGGEKQKIACASVGACKQKVVVLDEPSSNLDIKSIRELSNILKEWKEDKKTIIISEHRLYYLMPVVDYIIYMDKGRIIKKYAKEEFMKLFNEELESMGLRSLNPFLLNSNNNIESNNKNIVIRNLNFKYKNEKKNIVNIKSLSIPQNEIVGIIGNNGAGKSTFARCLCGLEKRVKGSIIIDDKEYYSKQFLKLSYMVMQDVNHQLFTESVLDEILLSFKENNDKTIQESIKILKNLDLLGKEELHPMCLSGGEKQRVAIGSAIACNKKILIFDEPTSGLDYGHMIETAHMFKKLKEEEKSLFIITHDIELIYKCCTYIIYITDGKVKWNGFLDETGKKVVNNFFYCESM